MDSHSMLIGGAFIRASKLQEDLFVIEPTSISLKLCFNWAKDYFAKRNDTLWIVNPKDVTTYYTFEHCKR